MRTTAPRSPHTRDILSCLALLAAFGALAGGCAASRQASARHPGAKLPARSEACAACIRGSCAAEEAACNADATPPVGPGQAFGAGRCVCASIVTGHPGASYANSVALCGHSDLYDARSACVQARCGDVCGKENVDT